MKTIFMALAIITGVFLSRNAVADTQYEAESATISGGATINSNHTGYSGTGFVDGFVNSTTSQVSFAITGATGGSYTIKLHYSAGGGTSTNTGLYVNGTKIKNITCTGTTDWNTWADETETVTLITGSNTVAYKAETASGSCINIDYIITVGGTDACAGIQGGGAGLTGATFGLNPPYTTGSEYCKATDGNINTYYDFSQGNGGYTGLYLGSAKVISKIRYYPRSNFASRMTGGKFQGSNDGSTYTDLYTISTMPPVQWNEVAISNSTGFRYVRYVSPTGGFGNIAEMEVYQAVTTYSLTISNDGHGTTTPPSGTITVNQGVATPISASTYAGYLFTNWTVTSGTATITDPNSASTNVTLSSGNATIQAHFTAHAPTGMSLSPMSVAEHQPSNTLVGTFSATDIDWNSTFSFSLVTDSGSNDNGSFGLINGNQLVTTASFNYATKNSYSIRIKVNDNTGLSCEKQFTISVTTVYANPTMTPIPAAVLAGTATTISWTPVSGALSYNLVIGSAVGGNDLYNGTAGTATSVNVTGLPNDGRTLYLRLTTTDSNGPHTYDFTYTACTVRPQAQNVSITGTLQVGQVLTGTYTYSYTNPEGTSTFKWYRADDATGTNRAAISGATQLTYTLTEADESKYVQFEVTPVAQSGIKFGLPTQSAFSAQITRGGFVFVYPGDCGAGENMKVDGMVVIGNVTSPTAKFQVSGDIKSDSLRTSSINCDSLHIKSWAFRQAPDYVFGSYKLPDLKRVDAYIKKYSHLPEVPSAEEMQKNGLDITKFNMVLLKKIEELTLYQIESQKKIAEEEKKIEELEKRVGK